MRKTIAIVLGILIFIGVILILIVLGGVKKTPPANTSITPAPTSAQNTNQTPQSPPTYNTSASQKALQNFTNRPTPQATSDTTIRKGIIDRLDGKSGTVRETANYRIEYLLAPNDFEVEILTKEANNAKAQAVDYLKGVGLTEDGICKLPIIFYLKYSILQEFKKSGQTFSSLPDFCL